MAASIILEVADREEKSSCCGSVLNCRWRISEGLEDRANGRTRPPYESCAGSSET
jgi:hypothetical protein